jgi:magnesium transporter
MMNVSNVIERLREIMEDETLDQLKEELAGFHSADLADIFQELKAEERLECFKLLDIEKAAELMEYLSPQMQVELLGDIDQEVASKILTKLPHDAAADVLGDMEEDESETYLDKLPHKFSEEVRELLTYNEDTAGGIMNPVVLTVNSDMTVQDVLNYIRIKAEKDNLELYYIYVTDKQNHLLGVVSLRKLLTSPANKKVEDIMISDIVKLHVDDYSDYITDEFMKYQYNALPVVDLYNRLKGMITWDDVHDLFEEETTEEIYQSSGISTEVVDEDEILSGNISLTIW